MRIKVAPGSAQLGATVIVIIVIGVYESHGNSLPPSTGLEAPDRRDATRSSGSTIESRCRSGRWAGRASLPLLRSALRLPITRA